MPETTEAQERLIRIETKLDVVLQQQVDFEGRIRALERWRYALPTSMALSATSFLAAMTAAILSHK